MSAIQYCSSDLSCFDNGRQCIVAFSIISSHYSTLEKSYCALYSCVHGNTVDGVVVFVLCRFGMSKCK